MFPNFIVHLGGVDGQSDGEHAFADLEKFIYLPIRSDALGFATNSFLLNV